MQLKDQEKLSHFLFTQTIEFWTKSNHHQCKEGTTNTSSSLARRFGTVRAVQSRPCSSAAQLSNFDTTTTTYSILKDYYFN